MFFLKFILLFFFIFFIHRLYLGYRLIKKIRDEVLINGKKYSRYTYNGTYSGGYESNASNSSSHPKDKIREKEVGNGETIEAEYRVIK